MSKLFYTQEKFDLNLKADAFEAYDQILTCISSYIRHAKVHPNIEHISEQNSSAAQLAELAEFECDRADQGFIHQHFFLPKYVKSAEEIIHQDGNLFAETINVPELVQELDKHADLNFDIAESIRAEER